MDAARRQRPQVMVRPRLVIRRGPLVRPYPVGIALAHRGGQLEIRRRMHKDPVPFHHAHHQPRGVLVLLHGPGGQKKPCGPHAFQFPKGGFRQRERQGLVFQRPRAPLPHPGIGRFLLFGGRPRQHQFVGQPGLQGGREFVIPQHAPLRVLDGQLDRPVRDIQPYLAHLVPAGHHPQRGGECEIRVADHLDQGASLVVQIFHRIHPRRYVVLQQSERAHLELLCGQAATHQAKQYRY